MEIAHDVGEKEARVHDLRSESVLLAQKAMRLDKAVATQKSELRALEAATRGMHTDMVRARARACAAAVRGAAVVLGGGCMARRAY